MFLLNEFQAACSFSLASTGCAAQDSLLPFVSAFAGVAGHNRAMIVEIAEFSEADNDFFSYAVPNFFRMSSSVKRLVFVLSMSAISCCVMPIWSPIGTKQLAKCM